jgi:uncharacterized protein (TIGR03437 family)
MAVFRACLIVVGWVCAVWAQAPAPYYTAAGIVNGASFLPGPLAPNALASIFGTNLSYYTGGLNSGNTTTVLPIELGNVNIFVDGTKAPLIYVSEKQINFLIPLSMRPHTAIVRVSRQGRVGPAVEVQVIEAAPALFHGSDGYLLAQHADGALITRGAPAAAGEIVVLYGVGFGPANGSANTSPTDDVTIPVAPVPIAHMGDLRVLVDGAAVDPNRVLYCGVTPGFGGLYQLNLRLPDQLAADPEIRLTIAGATTESGLKLEVLLTPQQPSEPAAR